MMYVVPMLFHYQVDTRAPSLVLCPPVGRNNIGTTNGGIMVERSHRATLSQSQGREGWSVIFRHPVLPDRATGKAGRRIRRGLGTRDKDEATDLIGTLNEILADRNYWDPSSRSSAEARFDSRIVDIFYHNMVPDVLDCFAIRETVIPLPR